MGDNAVSEKSVGRGLLGSVEELIKQDNIARFVLGLERPYRTDTQNPGHPQFLQSPDVGPVIQITGQDSMTAPMTRKKHHFTSLKMTGQKIVGWRAKRGFDLHPFLIGQAFDVIESATADDSNAMLRHGGRYSGEGGEQRANFDALKVSGKGRHAAPSAPL